MFPSQNPASPQYAAQKQKQANPAQPAAPQQPSASGIAGAAGGSANATAVSSNPNMQQRPQQHSNATQPKSAAPYIPQPQQPAPQRNYYGQPPKPVGTQPAQSYQPPMMSSQTAAGFGMPAGSGQSAPQPTANTNNLVSYLGATGGSSYTGGDPGQRQAGGISSQDAAANLRGAAANDSAAQLKQQLMSQGMSEQEAHQKASEQWGQQMGSPPTVPQGQINSLTSFLGSSASPTQSPQPATPSRQNADHVDGMSSAPGPAALGSFMGTDAGDPWSGAQGKPLDGGTSDLGPLGDAGIEQQPQGMTRRPMRQRSYYGQ